MKNFCSTSKTLLILSCLVSLTLFAGCSGDISPITAFSTDGHTVYHLKPAKVKSQGDPAVVSASFDGTVMCHTSKGKLLWEQKVNDYFPFDLAVADIDNDGLDEIFVTTAGGTVDAYDSDGEHLWSFKREATLFQVCPVKKESGEWVIFTGGVEKEVFILSPMGKLLTSFATGDVVRHIRKGDIMGDGKDYVAIATATTGLQGTLSLMLYEPETLKQLWFITGLGQYTPNQGNRFFSMIMFDINKDNKEDIVVCGRGRKGEISGYDYKGERIMLSSDERIKDPSYQMLLLSKINLKGSSEEYIYGLYGGSIIKYNRDGSYNSQLNSLYDFTNCAFDPQTGTYYLGSSVSGDDAIFAIHLDQEGWEKAFEETQPVGKLAAVNRNLATLSEQVSKFTRPDYQKAPEQITLNGRIPEGMTFKNLKFESSLKLFENYGDRTELWCREVDRRHKYDMSRDEIVRIVKEKEASGEDFILFAGHGSAFYVSPQTIYKIMEAAPKHLKGFLFSEMSKIDQNMQDVVLQLMLPLAEKCSASRKKIILLNKSIFWNASCYVDFWNKVLLNPKYSNVFIPSLEESNSRTQELSLAGRVGLWLTGSFDNWGGRVITDNANFDRMWEWSPRNVTSNHLRHMVLNAANGSSNFTGTTDPLFLEMMEKGVIAIPRQDELLSVSDLCLGMKSPPSQEFLNHGNNGGTYNFNEAKRSPLIFDRLDAYWAAAPLLDHDLSGYGYGCKRRMLNFLPEAPYGLIPIVPEKTDLKEYTRFKEKVIIDGEYFYDSDGKQHGAPEYKQIMLEKLQQSAERLHVLVKGVAWSVVRLDPNHVRVTLVDPGYTDPSDRNAEIILQHIDGLECTDILSGEKIEIKDRKIQLRVPAGIFRIVDIKYLSI